MSWGFFEKIFSRSRRDVRAVLIQVRERDDVALQERACFLERGGLKPSHLKVINLVPRPRLAWRDVARADAVFIGGAGIFSATRDDPFTQPLIDVIKRLVEEDVPLFGACWGHQLLARALGGEVVTDPDRHEVGTLEMTLTSEGRADPLFDGVPSRFLAQAGHNDYVRVLPPGGVNLAFSERCPIQAFRLKDKPVYGTQFHGELTKERFLERLAIYQREYLPHPDLLQEVEAQVRPTPHVDGLVKRFLDLHARRRR